MKLSKTKIIGLVFLLIFLLPIFKIYSTMDIFDNGHSSEITPEDSQVDLLKEKNARVSSFNDIHEDQSSLAFDSRIHGEKIIESQSYDNDDKFPRKAINYVELGTASSFDSKFVSIKADFIIGTEMEFNCYETSAIPESTGFFKLNFTLLSIGTYCYIWVASNEISQIDNLAPHLQTDGTGIINNEITNELAIAYDDQIYSTAQNVFGSMNDVDSDDHTYIMLYDIARNQTGSTVITSGYYNWFNDEPEITNPFWDTHSNQVEMFYIDTYPTIYETWYDSDDDNITDTAYNMWYDNNSYSELKLIVNDSLVASGAIAAQNYNLITNANDSGEEKWIRDGLCDYAIHHSLGNDHPILQNHVHTFLKYSDAQGLIIPDDHPWYTNNEKAQSYLFLLYLEQHYGGINLLLNINTDREHGLDGLTKAIEYQGYFDILISEIFRDFMVAVYIDDISIPNKPSYKGSSMQYSIDEIDLVNFPWYEPYNLDPYQELESPVLTYVSISWYIQYWYQKFNGYIPIGGCVIDLSDGGQPWASTSELELSRYLGQKLKLYETIFNEFVHVSSEAQLDIFFDGEDDNSYMNETFWSGDQKGVSEDGTSIATERDYKYLEKTFTLPSDVEYIYMDWLAWYNIENYITEPYLTDPYDYVQLELSPDNGITWYSLPWHVDNITGNLDHDYDPDDLYVPWMPIPPLNVTHSIDGYPFFIASNYGSHTGTWNHYFTNLTLWAGQDINIRFEYSTDEWLQKDGMWIDNITLSTNESILYFDDCSDITTWNVTGNMFNNGTIIPNCGWLESLPTYNEFQAVCIITDEVTGERIVENIILDNITKFGLLNRLQNQRFTNNETITLMIMSCGSAGDNHASFKAGLYNTTSNFPQQTIDFSNAPSHESVEGSVIFKWPYFDNELQNSYSILINNLYTNETTVHYQTSDNTFIWNTELFQGGDYRIILRSTELNYNETEIESGNFSGISTIKHSPNYDYTVENSGPIIDIDSINLKNLNITNDKYFCKFTINVTDISEIKYVWLNYSIDEGISFNSIELNYYNENIYILQFLIEQVDSMICLVQAEDIHSHISIIDFTLKIPPVENSSPKRTNYYLDLVILILTIGLTTSIKKYRKNA